MVIYSGKLLITKSIYLENEWKMNIYAGKISGKMSIYAGKISGELAFTSGKISGK